VKYTWKECKQNTKIMHEKYAPHCKYIPECFVYLYLIVFHCVLKKIAK